MPSRRVDEIATTGGEDAGAPGAVVSIRQMFDIGETANVGQSGGSARLSAVRRPA